MPVNEYSRTPPSPYIFQSRIWRLHAVTTVWHAFILDSRNSKRFVTRPVFTSLWITSLQEKHSCRYSMSSIPLGQISWPSIIFSEEDPEKQQYRGVRTVRNGWRQGTFGMKPGEAVEIAPILSRSLEIVDDELSVLRIAPFFSSSSSSSSRIYMHWMIAQVHQ